MTPADPPHLQVLLDAAADLRARGVAPSEESRAALWTAAGLAGGRPETTWRGRQRSARAVQALTEAVPCCPTAEEQALLDDAQAALRRVLRWPRTGRPRR
ncbi:hypothetical protein [Blastococcus sp. SYSU D00820]